MANLTPKQKKFCDEYLKDLNGTQAAIRAGYSTNKPATGFYVYLLINSLNNSIFYIGKGKGNRALSHERAGKNDTNYAKKNKIKEIANNGGAIMKMYMPFGDDEQGAFALESFLISKLKNTNITNLQGVRKTLLSDYAGSVYSRFASFCRWAETYNHTADDELYYFLSVGFLKSLSKQII